MADQSRLMECVPNFSEGRDEQVIRAIADAIQTVPGAWLLNVDPGKDANRTVMTLAGSPEAVVEAAFRSAKAAGYLIDMSHHKGAHPRFGALDVCPLVPIKGVSMEEAIQWSRVLGERLGKDLGLTVFLYEQSASSQDRTSLAKVRAGGYEGLAAKLGNPEWQPDFGLAAFNPRSGATAVGARDFLIAYNVNLNTSSAELAKEIARSIRERSGDRGLPGVKAIGWFLEAYGFAQVSMNLSNLPATPLHVAFEAVQREARSRGISVTGSELIGLTPLKALLEAGKHFLGKTATDPELVQAAVKSLGLDQLAPFDPDRRVLEYALERAAASAT